MKGAVSKTEAPKHEVFVTLLSQSHCTYGDKKIRRFCGQNWDVQF